MSHKKEKPTGLSLTLIIKFMISVFIPFFIGGTAIGFFFGVVGYYLSLWLGLYETQTQHKMVFWMFMGMGIFAGTVAALQSLIVFIKHKPKVL